MGLSLKEAQGTTIPNTPFTLFDKLCLRIDALDFSVRNANVLQNGGIEFAWEAATRLGRKHVPGLIRGFGSWCYGELREILAEQHLELGMELDADLVAALEAATVKKDVASDPPPVPEPMPTEQSHTRITDDLQVAYKRIREYQEELAKERELVALLRKMVNSGIGVVVQPTTPAAIARLIEAYNASGSICVLDDHIATINNWIDIFDDTLRSFHGKNAFDRVLAALKLLP